PGTRRSRPPLTALPTSPPHLLAGPAQEPNDHHEAAGIDRVIRQGPPSNRPPGRGEIGLQSTVRGKREPEGLGPGPADWTPVCEAGVANSPRGGAPTRPASSTTATAPSAPPNYRAPIGLPRRPRQPKAGVGYRAAGAAECGQDGGMTVRVRRGG